MTHRDVGHAIGVALCDAWGLDPRDVQNITIRVEPHELPVAVVRVLLNEKVIKHVLELVPRPANDGPAA